MQQDNKYHKTIGAFTLVEVVVTTSLLGLLIIVILMLNKHGNQISENIAIEQKLKNLSISLMICFRKDIRSSTKINQNNRKLSLTLHSLSSSGIPEKESIIYTWKDAVIYRKSNTKNAIYDFASIMGKGSSCKIDIIVSKNKSSVSIIIEIKSSTGKYLLRINETV